MSFPFYQAQPGLIQPGGGMVPAGAVPIYGSSPSAILSGQQFPMRGLIAASPTHMALLAAQDGSGVMLSSASPHPSVGQSTTAVLRSVRPGGANQTVLVSPAGGPRYLMQPSSQAVPGMPGMFVMQSLPGGILAPGLINAGLLGSSPGVEQMSLFGANSVDVHNDGMTNSVNHSADSVEGQQLTADHSHELIMVSSHTSLGQLSSLGSMAGQTFIPGGHGQHSMVTQAMAAGMHPSLILAQPEAAAQIAQQQFLHHQQQQQHAGLIPSASVQQQQLQAALQQHQQLSAQRFPGHQQPGMESMQLGLHHQLLQQHQQHAFMQAQLQEQQLMEQQHGLEQLQQQQLQQLQKQEADAQKGLVQTPTWKPEEVTRMSSTSTSSVTGGSLTEQKFAAYTGPREVDPDEPRVDPERTVLDFFNSDLHLEISKDSYSAEALTKPPGFCFCWAGVRATYGVCSGKICYEVLVSKNLDVDFGEGHQETDPHVIRVGWSMDHTSFQLGEEPDSFGYGGTSKFSTNNKFSNYGELFGVGDVITAMVDLESKPAKISFAKNGTWLGVALPLHGYKVGNRDQALYPHILSKNCRFEVNFGQRQPWYTPPSGYTFIDHVPLQLRARGMIAPPRKADCEMIMVVGLPGAGKTTWAQSKMKSEPHKRYNIIGTDTLIDKMRVMGLPRKNNYSGRWDQLIQKATNCLNKLFQIASRRRRNYILDQTNVYASARKRKMRHFVDFKRLCAVIQPEDDELKRREWKRTYEDGKVVPEDAVLEMKFNYTLPSEGEPHVDEIIWVELQGTQSEDLVHMYNSEAKERLPPREKSNQSADTFGQQTSQQLQTVYQQPVVGAGNQMMAAVPGSRPSAELRSSTALDYIKQEYDERDGRAVTAAIGSGLAVMTSSGLLVPQQQQQQQQQYGNQYVIGQPLQSADLSGGTAAAIPASHYSAIMQDPLQLYHQQQQQQQQTVQQQQLAAASTSSSYGTGEQSYYGQWNNEIYVQSQQSQVNPAFSAAAPSYSTVMQLSQQNQVYDKPVVPRLGITQAPSGRPPLVQPPALPVFAQQTMKSEANHSAAGYNFMVAASSSEAATKVQTAAGADGYQAKWYDQSAAMNEIKQEEKQPPVVGATGQSVGDRFGYGGGATGQPVGDQYGRIDGASGPPISDQYGRGGVATGHLSSDQFGRGGGAPGQPMGDQFGQGGGAPGQPMSDQFGRGGGAPGQSMGDQFGRGGGAPGQQTSDQFGRGGGAPGQPMGDQFGRGGGAPGQPMGDQFGRGGGAPGQPMNDQFGRGSTDKHDSHGRGGGRYEGRSENLERDRSEIRDGGRDHRARGDSDRRGSREKERDREPRRDRNDRDRYGGRDRERGRERELESDSDRSRSGRPPQDERGSGRDERSSGRDERGSGRDDRGTSRDERGTGGRDERGTGRNEHGSGARDYSRSNEYDYNGRNSSSTREDPRDGISKINDVQKPPSRWESDYTNDVKVSQPPVSAALDHQPYTARPPVQDSKPPQPLLPSEPLLQAPTTDSYNNRVKSESSLYDKPPMTNVVHQFDGPPIASLAAISLPQPPLMMPPQSGPPAAPIVRGSIRNAANPPEFDSTRPPPPGHFPPPPPGIMLGPPPPFSRVARGPPPSLPPRPQGGHHPRAPPPPPMQIGGPPRPLFPSGPPPPPPGRGMRPPPPGFGGPRPMHGGMRPLHPHPPGGPMRMPPGGPPPGMRWRGPGGPRPFR